MCTRSCSTIENTTGKSPCFHLAYILELFREFQMICETKAIESYEDGAGGGGVDEAG